MSHVSDLAANRAVSDVQGHLRALAAVLSTEEGRALHEWLRAVTRADAEAPREEPERSEWIGRRAVWLEVEAACREAALDFVHLADREHRDRIAARVAAQEEARRADEREAAQAALDPFSNPEPKEPTHV